MTNSCNGDIKKKKTNQNLMLKFLFSLKKSKGKLLFCFSESGRNVDLYGAILNIVTEFLIRL